VSPVWLLPCTLAVIAAVVLATTARAVRSELAALDDQIEGLSRLRERIRALQLEAERTGRATERTLDTLVPPASQ